MLLTGYLGIFLHEYIMIPILEKGTVDLIYNLHIQSFSHMIQNVIVHRKHFG